MKCPCCMTELETGATVCSVCGEVVENTQNNIPQTESSESSVESVNAVAPKSANSTLQITMNADTIITIITSVIGFLFALFGFIGMRTGFVLFSLPIVCAAMIIDFIQYKKATDNKVVHLAGFVGMAFFVFLTGLINFILYM